MVNMNKKKCTMCNKIKDVSSVFEKCIDNVNNVNNINNITIMAANLAKVTNFKDNFELCRYFRTIILLLVNSYSSDKFRYNSKEIFKNPEDDIEYKVNIANDDRKQKLFCLFILVFYLDSNIRAKTKSKTSRVSITNCF